MPREARGSKGFETYHIVVQGKRTVQLFEDNEDKQLYLEKLGKGCAERGAGLIGYCVLADHVHLLIAESEGRISDLMRSVHVMFTDAYRKRYGIDSEEPLLRGRFRSEKVESDRRLLEIIRYVHEEPVGLGFCECAEDYKWSSAHLYAEAERGMLPKGKAAEIVKVDTKRVLSILHFGGGYSAFAASKMEESKPVLEEVPESYGRSDAEAKALIEARLKGPIESLGQWPEEEKRAFLKRVRREDKIGILQLCRLTGMSRGIVQRL